MSRADGRVHQGVELRARQDASLPARRAAFPEHQHGGDGADVEALRRRRIAVGVELGHQHLPGAIMGELVDRKSTRLNSSHLVISYAVFCLKKKKKTF